jgi:HPt (histidine-containing phosphotransfer) domain-containing protein
MMPDSGEGLRDEAAPVLDKERAPHCAIDHDHLRRYTLGDQQLEGEVLELFAKDLPRSVRALRTARNDREWWVAAHTLKGSARAVGAWRVAGAAAAAEQIACAVDDPLAKAEAMAACDLAIADVISYIRRVLAPA